MHLRNDKRQNIQKKLDFPAEPAGEARQAGREETESHQTMHEPENPANTIGRMEEVCERENLLEALRRVKANKGSAGIDGMTVGQLSGYLKEHWLTIRGQLLNGTYEPATGKTRGDRETGRRRDAKAWYPDDARSISPASGDAGPKKILIEHLRRAGVRF
jgi:hypothetical protein